jgi:hypothetical protein
VGLRALTEIIAVVRVPHACGRVLAGYGVYARPVAAPGSVEFVTAADAVYLRHKETKFLVEAMLLSKKKPATVTNG